MYTKNIRLLPLLAISVFISSTSMATGELLFTVNNIRIVNNLSRPLISSRGSLVQLECLSLDNETVNISKGPKLSLSRSSRNYTTYTMKRMSCKDQGLYYCQTSRTSQRTDIGLNNCPVQLCQGNKSFRQITADIGETKTFVICIYTANPKAIKVQINNLNINKSLDNSKYQLSVRRKWRTSFISILNITIKNITLEDIGYNMLRIKTTHFYTLKYHLFIKYKKECILCRYGRTNLLIATNDNKIQHISKSRVIPKEIIFFSQQNQARKLKIRNLNSIESSIYNFSNICGSFVCTNFSILYHRQTEVVNVLHKNCPPFKVGETEIKIQKKDKKVQYRFKVLSYQNITQTVYLNKSMPVICGENASGVTLQCKKRSHKYSFTLTLSNWTRKSHQYTNIKIRDVQRKSLKMNLLLPKRKHLLRKKKTQFCQKGQTARFKFKMRNKLKKIKVNSQEIFTDTTSKLYYYLTLNTTLTFVINNVTSDDCKTYQVRIILLKGRKIKKRNFLIHLMRSNEKELLVNNMKTHQRLLIVKENSRINFTCKWTGFDVNKISLTRASTGKLLEKTTKLSLRHVVDNFTCTTMDTYICQIQPNRTDNNVASYVTTDVALVNCPPRTCFEKDKNVNLLSTSNVISLCILALDPQQWKPIIVRDTLHISSELEVNHTWQRINKSSLYFNITLFFGSPLPLDNGVHWLSIGDHVLTQLNVTGEIDINNERPFILIVNVCIFALVVLMVLVSILWKKKGSQIFYNLSKRIKWSSMIENVMPFKHIFFRDQLMSSDAATSSRTLQYVNLSQVMGNSHMDVLPQKTSVIGIRCEPGDSLAENDVLKRQTASHLSDEINVNSGVRSGKFNRLNCRSTQVYRSLRKAHKRLKLPQSAHRNVYENIQLLKTMGLDATQCSKAVSRQKTAMQNNEVYANTSHCYGIYNNYPSNEQDFQSNKFSKTTELRISQEKLTGKLQAGRYRSEEGLLYVTLSHDLARKRKSRSRNMKRNKNNSSINDDHVIYAEIDLAKNKRLAILERK